MKNLFTLSFALVLAITLQAQNWKDRVVGEGPVITRDFDIASFEKITLGTSGKLVLTQGSPQTVKIEGQSNILDLVETDVKDDLWKVGYSQPVGNHKEVVVYVTVPKLSYVKLSGSGDIKGTNRFDQASEVYVGISGSGTINMDFQTTNLASKISGSGDIDLEGKAENFSVKISGSGDIDAYNLVSDNTQISISGSGDCKVHANENLEAKINGSGDIYYKGKPRVQTRISGSGDLISKGAGSR